MGRCSLHILTGVYGKTPDRRDKYSEEESEQEEEEEDASNASQAEEDDEGWCATLGQVKQIFSALTSCSKGLMSLVCCL